MPEGIFFDSISPSPRRAPRLFSWERHPKDPRSDEEIFALVSQNKELYAVLIRRYERPLLSYLRRTSGGPAEELEDMAQNIFLKAYVYLHSFRSGEKFSNWFFSIAHNECIDHWRRNKKHSTSISLEGNENLQAVLRSEENLREQAEREWDREELRLALGEMPFKYREILALRFLEDRSYEELSVILRRPVATVGTLIRRAKKLFREILEEKYGSRK